MTPRHIACTLEQYHRRPEWSRSQLEVARESWPLFHGRFIACPPLFVHEKREALDIGTVAHTALLEPDGIDSVLAVIPSDVLNDQGHRKGSKWKQWQAERDGLILLKEEEAEPIYHMVRNVHADEAAEALLLRAKKREFTILFQHQETELHLRARLDLLCQCGDEWVIGDFKTSRVATEQDFPKHIADYGYHRQAAWYWDSAEALGLNVAAFVLIVVNKSPAHECFVQELDRDDIQIGREENAVILRELRRRIEANDWRRPGAGRIGKGHLPTWYRRVVNNE